MELQTEKPKVQEATKLGTGQARERAGALGLMRFLSFLRGGGRQGRASPVPLLHPERVFQQALTP